MFDILKGISHFSSSPGPLNWIWPLVTTDQGTRKYSESLITDDIFFKKNLMETNTWERKGSNTTYVWMLRGKEGEWVEGEGVTLFGYFLTKEGEGFGGVWITSNPLFLIPKNWRDLEEEWSKKYLTKWIIKFTFTILAKLQMKRLIIPLFYLILKTSK